MTVVNLISRFLNERMATRQKASSFFPTHRTGVQGRELPGGILKFAVAAF